MLLACYSPVMPSESHSKAFFMLIENMVEAGQLFNYIINDSLFY